MKELRFTLLMLVCISFFGFAYAQEEEAETPQEGWKRTGGFGADLSQLFMLNPKQGQGANRVGAGGNLALAANYKKDRIAWDNNFSVKEVVQRLGSGLIAQGSDNSKIPFEKSLDEIRFDSKVGYSFKEDSPFFGAVDLSFLSQLYGTYNAVIQDGENEIAFTNIASKLGNAPDLISTFLAPGFLNISVGLDYKPKENFSIFFSPISYKAVMVMNEEVDETSFGLKEGKKVDNQMGALLKGTYSHKFNERISWNTKLGLYSNYLREPQNVDVDWANDFDFQIWKGLGLKLTANLFYDHDVEVQVSDRTAVQGLRRNADGTVYLGQRANIVEQAVLTYTRSF